MRQMLSLPDDVISHMRKQGDMSKYITKLVRQDMQNEDLESKILRIVKREIEGKVKAGDNTPALDDTIGNSIMGILNI